MWIKTQEGKLRNLSLYRNLEVRTVGRKTAVVMTEDSIPIFQGNRHQCENLIKNLQGKLQALDVTDFTDAIVE